MTRRQLALVLFLIVDVGYIAWGASAAIAPDHLLGPGGKAILPAGYEGYSRGAWSALATSSAAYMSLLYRLYGVYCVLFGFMGSVIALTAFRRAEHWARWTLLIGNTVALVAAMTYDETVNAIGPFEVTEYLGLLMVWGAFAISAPLRARKQSTFDGRRLMKHTQLTIISAALATVILPLAAAAQSKPRLHVNTRWKQCSFQLDPSLTQSAWHQFTREAGQVVYFRPLTDARPMGRGKFELSLTQWQTNVDDGDSAWNDTFVHPDSLHWLYEGSGLQFPGLAFRAGVSSRSDVGLYFTKNVQANYGVYGAQLQQNLVRGARDWDVSARASFMSLFGPDDLDLSVYGVELVTSWKQWTYKRASVLPYAGVATYLASSHEKTVAVNLADERVLGLMTTIGAELQLSVLRVAAEASVARLPSFAVKLGFSR